MQKCHSILLFLYQSTNQKPSGAKYEARMGSRFLSHSRAIKPNFEEEKESQIEETPGNSRKRQKKGADCAWGFLMQGM